MLQSNSFRLSMFTFLAAALCLLIYFFSPQQLPVLLLKLAEITLGGVVGYWLDRHLFPYARPHEFKVRGYQHEILFASTMIRRAIVVGAVVLALAVAL